MMAWLVVAVALVAVACGTVNCLFPLVVMRPDDE